MRLKRLICGLITISFLVSCEKENVDKSYGNLSNEDVISIEQTSVKSYEPIIYKGVFEGDYNGNTILLDLDDDGDFTVQYKDKKIKGEWYKKDDGFMMEFDSKKKLPFQFLLWSDNQTIMILNSDGTADDEGGNYLTRKKN
jgi:hypothetical protein